MRPRRCGCPRMTARVSMNDDMRIAAAAVLDACRARGWQVATAESCTGGLVAGALTEIAGSSDVVDRGFVTYSNAAKQQMLGVPAATLRTTTARSAARPPRRWRAARLAASARASDGRDHRRRRARRRHAGQAGRAGAFRRGVALWHADPRRDALWRYRPRPRCGTSRCCRRWRCCRTWRHKNSANAPPIRRYWAKKNKSRGKLYFCCQASQTTSVGRKAYSTMIQPAPRRLSRTSM